MNFAKLRKKIDIQKVEGNQNSLGEAIETWQDYAINRWAELKPQSGNENFIGQQTVAEKDATFVIRFIKGVTPKMRVVYGGNPYDIQSVINVDERNRFLELSCKRVIDG